MPTYTYRCNDCNYEFDIRQKMSDAPLSDCPQCQAESSLRKVVNSVGIVFKGSGFYVTDNRNGSSKAAADTATGDTAKADSNGSAKKTEASTKGDGGEGKKTSQKEKTAAS